MDIMDDKSNMGDGGSSLISNFKLFIKKAPFLQAPRQSRRRSSKKISASEIYTIVH